MQEYISVNSTTSYISEILNIADQVHCNKIHIKRDRRYLQAKIIDSIIDELHRRGEPIVKIGTQKSNAEYIKTLNQKKEQVLHPNYLEVTGCQLFYRGLSDSNYSLLPSCFRDSSENGDESYYESYYYRQMEVICPDIFMGKSHFDHISTMQHYGCPTRLLDITSNPLVALYFACSGHKHGEEESGVVHVFAPRKNEILPYDDIKITIVSCIATLSRFEKELLYKTCCKALMDGQDLTGTENNVIAKLYTEIRKERPAFNESIDPLDLLSIYYVQPTRNNRRLEKQCGSFILSGLAKSNYDIDFLLRDNIILSIEVLNQNMILQELERLGINETTLFPEMEMVAKYLRKKQKAFMMDGSLPPGVDDPIY